MDAQADSEFDPKLAPGDTTPPPSSPDSGSNAQDLGTAPTDSITVDIPLASLMADIPGDIGSADLEVPDAGVGDLPETPEDLGSSEDYEEDAGGDAGGYFGDDSGDSWNPFPDGWTDS